MIPDFVYRIIGVWRNGGTLPTSHDVVIQVHTNK